MDPVIFVRPHSLERGLAISGMSSEMKWRDDLPVHAKYSFYRLP